MDKIKIVAIYRDENYIELPETSAYLTEKHITPNLNDNIKLVGNDYKCLNIKSDDIKNIATVKNRIINYSNSDIAIFLEF